MNCAECQELLVSYLEELLDDSGRPAVAEHLKNCVACRAELEGLQALQQRLVGNGKVLAQSSVEDEVMNRIIREQNVRLKPARQAGVGLRLRRLIMKSTMAKLAVAAVVALAVILGLSLFTGDGTGKLYARVVDQLHNARTLTYSAVTKTGLESMQTVRTDFAFKEPCYLRVSQPDGYITVLDYTPGKAKVMSLVPSTKTYAVIELSNMPDNGGKDPWVAVEHLRTLPARADEALGSSRIDARTLEGFRAREGDTTTTVWIDPKTGNLIRAEIEYANAPGMNTILTDFQVDVPLDDALFSLTPPEGYHLVQATADAATVTENDFIEFLRMWSKWTVDGTFPPTVNRPEFFRVAIQMGREGKLKGPDAPGYEDRQRDIIFRAMTFMGTQAGDTWRYAGQNVPFGDSQTPIFWYQPQGSPTWRVIYADLHVANVAAESLPK